MDQDSINQIQNFITICKKLASSRFIKEAKNIKFSLSCKDESAKITIGDFDEDFLRSFLIDFRKIYLTKEKTNFLRICNLIKKLSKDNEIINNAEKCQERYKYFLKNSTIGFTINEDAQKPEKIIDDWLHGSYFHEDENKKLVIDNLYIGSLIHKTIFLNTVMDLVHVSIVLSNNAILFLENESNFINPKK